MSPSTLLAATSPSSTASNTTPTGATRTPSPLNTSKSASSKATNAIQLMSVPWGNDSTNSFGSVAVASPGCNSRTGSNSSGMIATSLGVDSVMTQPVRSPATPVTPVAKQKLQLSVHSDSDEESHNSNDGTVNSTSGTMPALAKIVAPF